MRSLKILFLITVTLFVLMFSKILVAQTLEPLTISILPSPKFSLKINRNSNCVQITDDNASSLHLNFRMGLAAGEDCSYSMYTSSFIINENNKKIGTVYLIRNKINRLILDPANYGSSINTNEDKITINITKSE